MNSKVEFLFYMGQLIIILKYVSQFYNWPVSSYWLSLKNDSIVVFENSRSP
jgi:hypothetical protein